MKQIGIDYGKAICRWQIRRYSDVKTANDMIIEVQNSPINAEELHSRELFYGNMIWIVNGLPFKKNCHILSKLPDPSCDSVQDYSVP